MIDINNETLLSLPQAAKLFPPARGGKKFHLSTLLRWITKGVDGIRLDAVRVGGRWLVSKESLQHFAQRLTPDLHAEPSTPRTPSARVRAAERAGERLDKIGI